LRESGEFAKLQAAWRALARPYKGDAMHAFKLYTGEDNASHVLEGTLTLDRRTDVIAVHFKDRRHILASTGTTHRNRNTSSARWHTRIYHSRRRDFHHPPGDVLVRPTPPAAVTNGA